MNDLDRRLADLGKAELLAEFERQGRNISATARHFGMDRNTALRRLRRFEAVEKPKTTS